MNTASSPASAGGLYLVERYLGAAAAEDLTEAVARLAVVCDATSASPVRYLHSTYLPSEGTCFCLFRADNAEAVRAANARADITVDRLTDAVVMYDAAAAHISPFPAPHPSN